MTRLTWANASTYLFGLLRAEIFGGSNYEGLEGAKYFVILLSAYAVVVSELALAARVHSRSFRH